jgi:hypothetical protein
MDRGNSSICTVPEFKVKMFLCLTKHYVMKTQGERGIVVVKALCYKPEGRRFETR